ncbi:YihY/virulence factor BrkB family protein [Erythrobacter rubeus]|uniref:YihY/virulence factor BrkB family protein n=1 Tax=Erythrobacter rubeus TaxID=2760803 RepID=A0ABR8KV71_9SPHN|nr:YihY/virulence factor BrkB family protein [Erythrobacter rubeus]MBD2843260.1 YihY/virulence factor BrkB family protein [Erythrobacter rubeus]
MIAPADLSSETEQEVRSLSPEARRLKRRKALAQPAHLTSGATADRKLPDWRATLSAAAGPMAPGTRAFEVIKRTAHGTYNDGFIHAGNLAYLSMLAIFPFFIISGAIFQLIGEVEERRMMIDAVLLSMPPTVARVIGPVASEVVDARSGWLLWLGVAVALWTVSSLIETIRDILRRAYGTKASHAFWKYRLFSAGLILGAVILLMVSLFATVGIGAAQQVIDARFPQLNEAVTTLRITRIVPALGLAGSLYLLFYTLTPSEYRPRRYPKWPGALFTALWWLGVTSALPAVLGRFFTYNLTYGSLAGIIIALLFFWLVGLGLVIGAELNAALAEPDDCHEASTEEGCQQEEAA